MRLQPKKTVVVRNKVLGGEVPWICLPLVAEDHTTLLQQAQDVLEYKPDALEWRVDKFASVRDSAAVLASLDALRQIIGDIPLIFTCRIIDEGGFQEINADDRRSLNEAVIGSALADFIDTEISNGETIIGALKEACTVSGTKLILSYHNFDETPEEDFIVAKLRQAADMGADVAKAAFMPKDYGDVLTLLNATYTARTAFLQIPIITMSMGGEGGISRIAGGLFGSDLTFAIGQASSAPGQIHIGDIRKAWEVLPYGER